MKSRKYSTLDYAILALDSTLGSLSKSAPCRAKRPYPAESYAETSLDEEQRQHIAGLMRVNHAGEIAAQALYKAQALITKDKNLKEAMQESADEEIDHLYWCETRLHELEDHPSYLQPVWSLGSFGIGVIAGCCGDKWSLGFLAETEYQVVKHLDSHLEQLPDNDERSRAILKQMREDELHHATKAEKAGANTLPKEVTSLMRLLSKVMTKTAYKV